MKRLLPSLLLIVFACLSLASIPFSGPGVNTHGQLLPIDKLKAIGIRWVRGDVPVAELNGLRVKEFLAHYKGMPVLWILSQQTRNAPAVAKQLVSWGVTDIEITNEVDEAVFNLEGRVWTGAEYGRWFKKVRDAVGRKIRLYGPVLSAYLESFIRSAISTGMSTDAIDIHGYLIPDLSGFVDQLRARWRKPVIVSEVGPLDPKEDPAIYYLAWKMQMGDRPWCWYDGPATDWRGLFAWTSGYSWLKPTALYQTILKSLMPAVN